MKLSSLGTLAFFTTGVLALSQASLAHAQLNEEAKVFSSDAQSFDSLGYTTSISGDTLLLGAPDEESGGAGNAAGSAYVFVRSGSSWIQQAKLIASDAAVGDKFGLFVQLQGDTAVLTSWGDDRPGLHDAGAAYVFVRSGTSWSEQAKLTASDAASLDTFFGIALDGDTAIVGARQSGVVDAGAAYVFVRSGTSWTEQAKLTASDAADGDYFGWSVALQGDTAVISAPFDNHSGAANAGSAYVFVRVGGTTWTEQAKLTASDAAADDNLGLGVNNVSISGDTVVVGAAFNDHTGFTKAGAAYVFVRNGTTTTWTEEAKLTASDAAGHDRFGWSVSVAGDRAVVGSPSDDDAGVQSGSAYAFVRTGTTWSERTKLLASDGAAGDSLGVSVSLDGDEALVGAWHSAAGGVVNSGAAYTFCLGEASASFRNAGSNPASYTCNAPALGGTFSAAVDLTTTGHSFAQLSVRTTAIDVALPGGLHVLCGGPSLGLTPLVPGPLAGFSIPVPSTSALCGLALHTQALHIGGVLPFSLSNAQDLVIGL